MHLKLLICFAACNLNKKVEPLHLHTKFWIQIISFQNRTIIGSLIVWFPPSNNVGTRSSLRSLSKNRINTKKITITDKNYFSKALRIGFISFNLSSLEKGCLRFELLRLELFKNRRFLIFKIFKIRINNKINMIA